MPNGWSQLRRRLLAARRTEICNICLPGAGDGRGCCGVAHECIDWLQHCLMNINAKIFENNFRCGSMLK